MSRDWPHEERRHGYGHDSECNNPTCQEAADRAVKKVFAILGVDIDKPESVEDFRADLRFGKNMRKAANHGVMAFTGLVVFAMGAALWAGVITKIKGGP